MQQIHRFGASESSGEGKVFWENSIPISPYYTYILSISYLGHSTVRLGTQWEVSLANSESKTSLNWTWAIALRVIQ